MIVIVELWDSWIWVGETGFIGVLKGEEVMF
jgi:hypothetical protein